MLFYFWLHWVFFAACRLSLVSARGGYSSLRCMGFSLQWLLLSWSMDFRHVGFSSVARGLSSCGSWALEHRLSSCGTQAYLLHGMWDPPGPGLEPMSSTLAGRFLTTVPPGKPSSTIIIQGFLLAGGMSKAADNGQHLNKWEDWWNYIIMTFLSCIHDFRPW